MLVSVTIGVVAMKSLDRSVTELGRLGNNQDDGYVEADHSTRFGMVWELTLDAWAFAGNKDVEQRLQRDVAHLVGRGR